MWVLRILNGPMAGHTFELNKSVITVGRGSNCDIVIKNPNVSKTHLKIEIQGNQVKLTDLESRNGSFYNGVKFNSQVISDKERISLHQIFIDFVKKAPQQAMIVAPVNISNQDPAANLNNSPNSMGGFDQPQLGHDGLPSHAPAQVMNENSDKLGSMGASASANLGIKDRVEDYIENVLLSGIYKLAQWAEFKWVLAGFMATFVLLVTTLSAIPLMKILRDSIQQESRLRAKTISRTLADINRQSINSGIKSAVTVDFVEQETGVNEAYIIETDGTIIAPPNKSGVTLVESSIQQARIDRKESVSQINDDTIVSITPIKIYDKRGNEITAAFSVVKYNMGTLSLNDERTLSLYIQTLFIALIIGSIIYFFLYKLVEHPIASLNKQLNKALADNSERIEHKYKHDELQGLISNINSALSRITNEDSSIESQAPVANVDRTQEMENIVQLVGFSALCISAETGNITAVNQSFEDRVGMTSIDLVGSTAESISDQALKLSIQDLIAQSQMQPHQILTNNLDFSDASFDITLQPVWEQSSAAYYIIVMLPSYEEGAA